MDTLENVYNQYSDGVENPEVPRDLNHFIPALNASHAVLAATGLTNQPGQGVIPVGANSSGTTIYSHPQLSNNKDITMGQQLTTVTGGALGAMGAFADHNEANRFFSIGAQASDEGFHNQLDEHKNNQDIKGFVGAIKNMSAADLAPHKVDLTAYRLYNTWGNMSPGQKSLALASTGLQGYTFQDGHTFDTKQITPSVLGVPGMDAGEAVQLAAKGINMAPATAKWSQLAAVQRTQFDPSSASDVAITAHNMNLLGLGQNGAAVNIDESKLSQLGATPVPHYGIGAVSTPTGAPMIPGYSAVGKAGDKNILVPEANGASAGAMRTPDIATRAAYQVYKNWGETDGGNKQTQGVLGGSALSGGLSGMASSNPYTLGAVATHATFSNVAPTSTDDLGHVMQMGGVTLHRLVDGKADAATDEKGLGYKVKGLMNPQNYDTTVHALRAAYSQNGVPSKEVGYQLANQAYAEGRLNDIQHAAAMQTMNMIFDPTGYTLAQKLLTGKQKGLELARG